MRCRLIFSLAFCCLSLATNQATADVSGGLHEHARLYFSKIGNSKTIPEDVNTATVQDSVGFLWFGTQNGLVRYDGYHFRVFTHDQTDPDSLPGNYVRAMWADNQGQVWVGTDNDGVAVYSSQGNKTAHYVHDENAEQRLSHNNIRAITGDNSGHVFIGTNHGLDVLFTETGVIKSVEAIQGCPVTDFYKRIRALYWDPSDTLWVGSGKGLCRLSTANLSTQMQLEGREVDALSGYVVFSLFQDQQGRILAGSNLNPVTVIDPSALTVTHPELRPQDSEETSPIWIFSMAQPTADELWLASYGSGIFVLDSQTLRVKNQIRHNVAVNSSLSHDEVGPMLVDQSGLLWIGTWGGGVNRVNPASDAIRTLRHNPEDDAALSDASIYSVIELPEGQLAIGNGSNSVDVVDQHGQRIHTISLTGSAAATRVGALALGPDGTLWIGTNRGVYTYDSAQDVLQPFSVNGEAYQNQVVRLMQYDDQWLVILHTEGFHVLDVETGTLYEQDAFTNSEVLANVNLTSMVGYHNELWLGTSKGLYILSLAHKTVTPVSIDTQSELSNNSVKSLLVDSHNRLWVATTIGMDVLNEWDGSVARFDSVNRLLGTKLQYLGGNLLEDNQQRIWTDNALIDPATWQWQELTESDGWDVGPQWYGSYSKTRDGTLLYGGTEGLLVVKPELFRFWDYSPPVVISELSVNNQRIPLPPDTLVLPPDTRNLSMEFTALDFTDPEQIRYQYRLAGYDQHWQQADAENHRATYTGLSPGSYQLEVQATNRIGRLSDHVLRVNIQQQASWYQTWWFKVFVSMLLISALYLLYKLRIRQLEKQRLVLDGLVKSRTRNIVQLGEMGQGITASLDLEQVLQSVYDNVTRLMHVDVFMIGRVNEESGQIESLLAMHNGQPAEVEPIALTNPAHAAARCISQQAEIVISNLNTKPESLSETDVVAGVFAQSKVFIPLISKNKTLGVISVQNKQADSYSDNDVQMLRTIAAYAAIAIDNANAHQQLEQAHQEIYNLSLTDQLTGARNRRFMNLFIDEELARLERLRHGDPQQRLAVVLLDIDFFKQVNDTHGHSAGDEVLTQFVGLLKECLRQSDWIVRIGGEEFLVLSQVSSIEQLSELLERLCRTVAEHRIALHTGIELHKTVSIGACLYPFTQADTPSMAWTSVLEWADKALYQVKENGRNGWMIVSDTATTDLKALQSQPEAGLSLLKQQGLIELTTSLK
jgi:diguanylate cyclase (GGDEF)-like protein